METKKIRQVLRCLAAGAALVVLGGCLGTDSGRTGFLFGAFNGPREKSCVEEYSDKACLGESAEGVPLTKMKDEWYFSCDDDDLEGERTCEVRNGHLSVFVSTKAKKLKSLDTFLRLITFGGHKYPRSQMIIRIDDAEPIRWGEDEHLFATYQGVYQDIVEQLKIGKKAHTRYTNWPNRNDVDDKFSVEGFALIYEEAVKKVSAYKK